MFFKQEMRNLDAKSGKPEILEAIAEWAIQQYLTIVPLVNGLRGPYERFPTPAQLRKHTSLEQLDKFKNNVKEKLFEALAKTPDCLELTPHLPMELNEKSVFLQAAKDAGFPNILIPVETVTWPTIYFSEKHGVTSHSPGSGVGDVFLTKAEKPNAFKSRAYKSFRDFCDAEAQPASSVLEVRL